MLSFKLTPEQEELREKARRFALEEILPLAWSYDEKNETPMAVLRKAHEAGIMNTGIPKNFGGQGLGVLEGVLLTEEIAAADAGIATSIFDSSLGMAPVILSSNQDVKEKYLAAMAREFKLLCFATSEPTMGSDVAGIRCRARRDGDDYILSGTKYWVTNGGIADYMTIFATVDPDSKHKGICAFLVERDWDGVTVGKHIPKLGQRSSNTVGLNFKDVRIPRENVLAHPGEGFILAMRTFSLTRPAIGAFAVGTARSALEFALDYVQKRRAFGMPLANFQALQFKLAEMYQKIETSRLLTWKSAWEADNGLDPTITSSIAKFYSSESAMEVVNDALQLFGGFGYTKMFPAEKLMRDARLFTIYEGTSEIQRLVVSGHLLTGYKPVMPPLEDLPILRETEAEEDFISTGKQVNAWRCRLCGYVHYENEAPEECPYCFFPGSAFKKIWPRQ